MIEKNPELAGAADEYYYPDLPMFSGKSKSSSSHRELTRNTTKKDTYDGTPVFLEYNMNAWRWAEKYCLAYCRASQDDLIDDFYSITEDLPSTT